MFYSEIRTSIREMIWCSMFTVVVERLNRRVYNGGET